MNPSGWTIAWQVWHACGLVWIAHSFPSRQPGFRSGASGATATGGAFSLRPSSPARDPHPRDESASYSARKPDMPAAADARESLLATESPARRLKCRIRSQVGSVQPQQPSIQVELVRGQQLAKIARALQITSSTNRSSDVRRSDAISGVNLRERLRVLAELLMVVQSQPPHDEGR